MRSSQRAALPLVLIATAAILACSGHVTQANFNRIENDMPFDQVVGILGQPTESKSIGIGPLSGTAATWEGSGAVITITFVNEKVKTKSFSSKPEG